MSAQTPLASFGTATVHHGLIVAYTWFGTRWVASPRAHRMLSNPRLPLWRLRILRKRYIGRV